MINEFDNQCDLSYNIIVTKEQEENQMTDNIDERVLRYIPKRYRHNLTWLEKCHNECDNSNVYFITYDFGGTEVSETCDTIDEVVYMCRQICQMEEAGEIYQ